MSRGQSPVEFIIVVFLFLLILFSVFTAFVTKLHPEIEKAREQKSCINANGVAAYLLKEPGVPENWNATNMQIFGLTNGTADQVSYDKWLAAKSLDYIGVRNKTVPDTSFLLSYNIYAFKPSSADTCLNSNNSAVICRFNLTLLQINAFVSNSNATLNLKLFFPFSTATVQDTSSLESDDTSSTSTANGTIVSIGLHTNKTDSDSFNVSFSQTNLVFIQRTDYKTVGLADIPIFIGNTSAVESFGSAGTGANNYCEAERAVNLVSNNEIFLARFDILAW